MAARRLDSNGSRYGGLVDRDGSRRHPASVTSSKFAPASSHPSSEYPPPPYRAPAHTLTRPSAVRRWPPSPSVEEEDLALRREVGTERIGRGDEVSQRGSIDQEPIIVDAGAPSLPQPRSRNTQSANSNTRSRSGVPTPPTSDDERKLRARRNDYSRTDGNNALPTSTSNSRPSPTSTFPPAPARKYPTCAHRPPEATLPPPTSAPSSRHLSQPAHGVSRAPQQRATATPAAPSAPAALKRFSTVDSPVSTHAAVDVRDLDDAEAKFRRARHRSTISGGPDVPTDLSGSQSKDHPPRPAASRRPLLSDDNRRHTDSWMEVPREHTVEGMRKPAPLMVASLVREATGHSPTSSGPAKASSGGKASARLSPQSSNDELSPYPPSPPRSPRQSGERSRDPAVSQHRRSLQSSADASMANSPQHSPKLAAHLPNTANGWQTAFDNNTARTNNPTTRLAQSTRAADLPRLNLHGTHPSRSATNLPYPVDDFTTAMPEERDHQYFPDGMKPLLDPSPMMAKTIARAGSPVATSRPGLHKHHSLAELAPASPSHGHGPRETRKVSLASGNNTAPAVPGTAAPLPPCPRSNYVSGYSDWSTLDDCPNFDICPGCLSDVFGPTFYATFFRPVSPGLRPLTAKVRCDFSSPWLRLAWLLTLQRQTPNLMLLKTLYLHLESSKPCPDTEPQPRQWFTVLDDATRRPLRDFHVCATDVRSLEILLPALRGFFVPYPRRTSSSAQSAVDPTPRMCSLRPTRNNRYVVYLDVMISLHEASQKSTPPRIPDMTPFVQYLKHKLDLDECPRDNIMQGGKWYYIPSVPEFTVCEDCHDDVLIPFLRTDSDLVMRFNRNKQYLPSANSARPPRDSVNSVADVAKEASCSLYSSRMRRLFHRVVQESDLKYLAKKAKERKEKETELQRRAQPAIARMQELDAWLDKYRKRPGFERDVQRRLDERAKLEDKLEQYRDEWVAWE